MNRYFFDMRDGANLIPDDEGINLSTIDDAHEEALRSLGDIARDPIRIRRTAVSGDIVSIEVRDDKGPLLMAKIVVTIARLN